MTKDNLRIRFFRGESEIGETTLVDGQTILEAAEDAGVDIPPGLDEYLIGEGGILSCCLSPTSSCQIDVRPPL